MGSQASRPPSDVDRLGAPDPQHISQRHNREDLATVFVIVPFLRTRTAFQEEET